MQVVLLLLEASLLGAVCCKDQTFHEKTLQATQKIRIKTVRVCVYSGKRNKETYGNMCERHIKYDVNAV